METTLRKTPPKITPASFSILDGAMGILICLSIVVSPWAFGTVHKLTITALNIIGYSLGLALLGKWAICRWKDFSAPRWTPHNTTDHHSRLTRILVFLSLSILAFIFVHAINARASLSSDTLTFTYYASYISWLPHSYDASKTWDILFNYSALCMGFWATRDWLLTPTKKERALLRSAVYSQRNIPTEGHIQIPTKLRALLFLIVANGALIAFIGILQKLDGTNKLLWLFEPTFLKYSRQHFGPFAYRGNAGAYLNMIWPLSILLLFVLKRQPHSKGSNFRLGSGPEFILYPIILILLIAPFTTESRAAAIITTAGILGVAIISIILTRERKMIISFIGVFIVCTATITYLFGPPRVIDRLSETIKEGVFPKRDSRIDIYKHFPSMISAHGIWGSGPGAFSSIYLIYRSVAIQANPRRAVEKQQNDRLVRWSAWAHCDPIEYLITFGSIGFAIILTLYILTQLLPFFGKSFFGIIRFIWPLYLSQWMLIFYSFVDFPFQIYSLLHLFILLSAILTVVNRGLEGPQKIEAG